MNTYAKERESFPPAVIGPGEFAPERQLAWTCDTVATLGAPPAEGPKPGKALQERTNRYFEGIAGLIDRDRAWDDPANKAAVDTPIRYFLCPASPDFDPNRSPGLTNYVGMAGIGPGAARLKRDDPRAGVFGYDRGVRPKELGDNTSYTIMVLETIRDLGPWPAGGTPTLRELDPDEEHYLGPGRPFGGMHLRQSWSLHGQRITNVLYADGSVRPMSDRTEGEVVRQQATIRRP